MGYSQASAIGGTYFLLLKFHDRQLMLGFTLLSTNLRKFCRLVLNAMKPNNYM